MNGSFKAALVAIAIGSHITGTYIVGATKDEWLDGYKANIPSILFVLAVSLLMIEQDLTPYTDCPMPSIFEKCYNILAMIFMTSLGLRLVWLPLGISVARLNLQLTTTISQIPFMEKPPMNNIVKFLSCPSLTNLQLFLISSYMLWGVVKTTGAYERILEWINTMRKKCDENDRESSPEENQPRNMRNRHN